MRILLLRQFDLSSPAARLFGGADRTVCSLLGLALIAAATMKAVTPLQAAHFAGWLGLALAIGETTLGLFLLLNLFPKVTRLAALVAFSGFAAYSLRAVLDGRLSCGCFGDVQVPPQATLAFDLLAIAMILLTLPQASTKRCGRWRDWLFPAGFAASALALLGAGYLAGPAGMTREGSDLVIFDPQEWVGRRLPFLDEIDIGDELSRGTWTVLLYRHDCPNCEAALARYYSPPTARLAEQPVALIELLPYREPFSVPSPQDPGRLRLGRIDVKTNWFIQTPCEICLRDEEVVAEMAHGIFRSDGELVTRDLSDFDARASFPVKRGTQNRRFLPLTPY